MDWGVTPTGGTTPAGNPHTTLGVVAAVVSPKADALLWQNDALVVGLVAAAFDSPARDGSDFSLRMVGGWRKVGRRWLGTVPSNSFLAEGMMKTSLRWPSFPGANTGHAGHPAGQAAPPRDPAAPSRWAVSATGRRLTPID